MVNKEGILFIATIAFFVILYVAQIVIAGYIIKNTNKFDKVDKSLVN